MSTNSSYSKVTILPIEGDAQAPISTMYNPKELSFTKSAGWSDDNVGIETNHPALSFTAGQAITLSIEFFFDLYEKEVKDVRPIVKSLIHLCEIQKIDGEQQKRPPRVRLVWSDADPIGVGNFTGVVESAQAKYIMFTSAGIPCRASVVVQMKQADDIVANSKTINADGTVTEAKTYNLSSMTPVDAAGIDGMKEALESKGAKIEDKSTWPASITVEKKSSNTQETE